MANYSCYRYQAPTEETYRELANLVANKISANATFNFAEREITIYVSEDDTDTIYILGEFDDNSLNLTLNQSEISEDDLFTNLKAQVAALKVENEKVNADTKMMREWWTKERVVV